VNLCKEFTRHSEPIQTIRVLQADILAAARKSYGLERMNQIEFGILERDGSISIIRAAGMDHQVMS
jgi:uncharacterized membrane protein YcaP (DUF421 family)